STYYDNTFTDRDLWRMVTINAARALHADEVIGSIDEGLVADIAIYDAKTLSDYRAIIDGQPAGVALVLRGGEAVYGDATVIQALASGTCDTIDVCGTSKRLCATDDIGKSFSALQTSVGNGIYPAFFCGAPDNEPSCKPMRQVAVMGSTVYSGDITAADEDGDGIPNASDNCPTVFNPVRPLDGGVQANFDGDADGDACDPCPINADTDICVPLAPGDSDGDGVLNAMDNCPTDPNPGQEDADNDDKGDVCDDCAAPNPGNSACPTTIYEIKQGNVTGAVALDNVLVTGCAPTRGYFVQHKAGDPDYTAPEYSGVFVYAPTVDCAAFAAGTRLDISTANVADFFGQTQLTGAMATATSTGEAAPTPVVLSPAEAGGATANEYEAVLVRVDDAVVSSINPTPGPGDGAPTNEFEVDGTLRVDDYLFLTSPFPNVGTTYASITGIAMYKNNAQKLEPRSAADLVLGNPTLAGFSLPSTFVRVGQTNAPSIPDAVEVVLTAPAQGDTFVAITGGAGFLTVQNGGVTIPDGASTATVSLSGSAVTALTVLTASLAGDTDTLDVRVLSANEAPTALSITPATATIATGGTALFTVTLDIPAPPAGFTVDLDVSPLGSGSLPATLSVPGNETTASFTYTDLAIDDSATVTASAGALSDTADITIAMGSGGLVINEVDYDTAGTDTGEFIEIFNPTSAPVDLTGYTVRLVNGSNNAQYGSVTLTGTL
ncbi:MAG: lamin tail domain-containing protein, partial [Myxococcales bacterium]|nr:lamin tail domain-containing protein [Myxococcales bacterium]